jgi:hypothetical protein
MFGDFFFFFSDLAKTVMIAFGWCVDFEKINKFWVCKLKKKNLEKNLCISVKKNKIITAP